MIVHLVIGQPTENLSASDTQELLEAFASLARLTCVQGMTYGKNVSERAQGYDYAAVIHFQDQQALDTYMTHPDHLKAVEVFNRFMPQRLIIDYHPNQ